MTTLETHSILIQLEKNYIKNFCQLTTKIYVSLNTLCNIVIWNEIYNYVLDEKNLTWHFSHKSPQTYLLNLLSVQSKMKQLLLDFAMRISYFLKDITIFSLPFTLETFSRLQTLKLIILGNLRYFLCKKKRRKELVNHF